MDCNADDHQGGNSEAQCDTVGFAASY